MPKKQTKKKPIPKKKAKKPAKTTKKAKPKLKKSAARSAVRKAVAKRTKTKKKTVKKMAAKKKTTKKTTKKKTAKKKITKKKVAKKKTVKKKPTKKPATKKKTTKKAATKKKAAKKAPTRKTATARRTKKLTTTKKTSLRKAPKKKAATKKTTKKKATKKAMGAKAAKKKPLSPKPKIKDKKPVAKAPEKPINRAEISKLLSDAYARHLIIESGGEHALEIVRGFSNNSSVEEMCKKLKIKISDVRATLNRLHSLGIVDYTRHKDSETGWFSYYWSLNVDRMKSWVNQKIDEEHRNHDFSNGEHYYCPNCGGTSIHDFVSASDFGFKCPTCSNSLDFLSQSKAQELFPVKAFRKPLL